MDIKAIYQLYQQHKVISTDSRNITPGCIFFALKGEHFNGNQFASQAVEQGASAAIVDEDTGNSDERIIRVADVLGTLQDMAAYHRNHCRFIILAVTGSNGKTTTKELCRQVLSKKYSVFATTGNLNNHIGVPLTLLSMDGGIQAGVIEMGANHPGEIALLCRIANPNYGLITNIGKAHLEGFGGIHGVAKAKGELFEYLMNHKQTLFVNEGNPYLPGLVPAEYTKVFRYNGATGLRAEKVSATPYLAMNVAHDSGSFKITTHLVGRYNAENVLAACAVGFHFGIDHKDIADAIASYVPQNNRSQLIQTEKNKVYMDAYNANPSSMAAAIQEFLTLEGKNKLLILGEMREVGASAQEEHEELINELKNKQVNNVICVGSAFEEIAVKAGYQHFQSVDELNRHLQKKSVSGYLIFVKGSRSNRLEKVINYL
jgi:UDP-N-acetylmuramoyl-tripeptide--D-alanyl-D-alanine ligase